MLKLIALKLQIVWAIISVFLYNAMCDNGKVKKLHIDYDVRGIASIRSVDRLELELDSAEIFYENSVTAHLRNNEYLQHRFGLIKQSADFVDDVNMESFRAVETVNGEVITYTREEYMALQPYRQDQFRVVFPNGRIITDKAEYEAWVKGNTSKKSPIAQADDDFAMDETFALPV